MRPPPQLPTLAVILMSLLLPPQTVARQTAPSSPQCVCFARGGQQQHVNQQKYGPDSAGDWTAELLFCRNSHSLPGGGDAAAAARHFGAGSRLIGGADFRCSEGRLVAKDAGIGAIDGELARSLEVAPRVQWVDLSGNRLTALVQSHFASMPNLVRLELQENAISEINYLAFDRLSMLGYLDLEGNKLTEVTSRTFGTNLVHPPGARCGLRSLRYLYLGRNRIQRIEPRSFECLEYLLELRLQHNEIAVLPNFVFRSLVAMRSLRLHGNRLESVEEFAFSHCCRELRRLSLVDNRLNYLPDVLFSGMSNLTTLYLDRNHFAHIPTLRGPTRLADLHLQRNYVVRIRRRDFVGLESVDSLNLYDNSVQWIEDASFVGLGRTVNLVLQKNEISRVGRDTFAGLTGLRYLVLTDNRIDQIEDLAFRHLPKLDTLSMAGNRLVQLRSAMFDGLNRTFALSLGSNYISNLQGGEFSQLRGLKYLYLEKNSLTKIGSAEFAGLGGLKKLDLSDNHIASLDHRAFADLGDLAFLDLSGNRLRRLCSSTLHRPSGRLSYLSVAKNQLEVLDPEVLGRLNRLRVLDMSDNRLAHFAGDWSDPQLTGGPGQLRVIDLGGNPLRLSDCALCGLETVRAVRLTFPNASEPDRLPRRGLYPWPGLDLTVNGRRVDPARLPNLRLRPCAQAEKADCLTRHRRQLDADRSAACQPESSASAPASSASSTDSPSLAATNGGSVGLHHVMLFVSVPALAIFVLVTLAVLAFYLAFRRNAASANSATEPSIRASAGRQIRREGYEPDGTLLELNIERSSTGSEIPKFANKIYGNLL